MIRTKSGKVIYPESSSDTSAIATETSEQSLIPRLVQILKNSAITAFIYIILAFLLGNHNPQSLLQTAFNGIALGLLVVVGACKLLYSRGRRRMHKVMMALEPKLHEAILPSLSYGTSSPYPHPAHRYWTFLYDASRGDIVVTGRFNPTHQRYWSINLYNEYGLPNAVWYTDETVKVIREVDGWKEYEILLTTSPKVGVPNQFDVSRSQRGIGMVRVICTKSEETFGLTKPNIQVRAIESAKDK